MSRTLVNDSGDRIVVEDRDLAGAFANGYHVEGAAEHAASNIAEGQADQVGGVGGTLAAGGLGFLRGATLGLSDLASYSAGDQQAAADLEHAHGTASTIGQIAGAVVPSLLSGGALTPSGAVSDLATSIAESGGGGLGRTVAAGALEGGVQNAGSYVSQVALGDRDLSAESFVGAMGEGALFGGVAAGGLRFGGETLTKASKLFGKAKKAAKVVDAFQVPEDIGLAGADDVAARVTSAAPKEQTLSSMFPRAPEQAANAERDAADAMQSSIGDSDQMIAQARAKVDAARRSSALDDFGGGPELAAPRAAFRPPPTLEGQLAGSVEGLQAGETMGSLRTRGALDAQTQKLADAADRLKASQDEVAAFLGKTIKPNGAHAAAPADDLAEQIASGVPEHAPAKTIDVNDALKHSLGHRAEDAATDLGQAIDVIGRHEQAQADLADALGAEAPAGATERASALKAAQSEARKSVADSQILGAGDMENAVAPAAAASEASGASRAKQLLGAAQNVGSVVEVLHDMGVPGVPDPSAIPIIGPVLSLYLKAKAMMMVGKRIGLKIPQTAESIIAGKAARTGARVSSAIANILDGGGKAIGKIAPEAAAPAAILGHKLFDDGNRATSNPIAAGRSLDERNLAARRDELARAAVPGAVEQAVRNQVRSGDPTIVSAIADAARRKLDYLNGVMPKPPIIPGVGPGATASWHPAPGQITSFARSAQAADDPASVLEHLADTGQCSYEAAEALRNVYPSLFADAQRQILMRAADRTEPLPYAKRVSLSVLFRVPLDGTMQADFGAALAAHYQAPQAAAPPTPGMVGDVSLGSRSLMPIDQR